MSAIITNLAGKHAKRVVTQHASAYEPVDPLYIFYDDDNGKPKRVKVSGGRSRQGGGRSTSTAS